MRTEYNYKNKGHDLYVQRDDKGYYYIFNLPCKEYFPTAEDAQLFLDHYARLKGLEHA
jgi:hypothetical protein